MATAGIWPVCCHPFFAGFRRVCRPVPCLIDSRSFQHQATRHRCMEGSRRVRALKKGRRSAPAWRRNSTSYFIIPSKRRWLTSFSCPVRSPFPATKTTRYWEEHETYHYWRNPSTTENGLGLTTVGGCITGGTGKGESDEQWENLLPDGFPSEKGFSYVGGGNQYDGRAKDNGESFIETEPLPQMKFNMWEEDEEEESDSYFKTK